MEKIVNGNTNTTLPIIGNEDLSLFSFVQLNDFYRQGGNTEPKLVEYNWDKIKQILGKTPQSRE